MTKEALQELGLTEDQIAKVLELKGKAIAAEQKRADKAEKDRDQWKSRAEAAEETLKGFDGVDVEKLNTEIADWKKKAEQAEADYKQQIYDRDFADTLKSELENIKFSSAAAKKAIMAEIKEAGLKLKDGKILGLSDLISQIREKDATAFEADDDGKQRAKFTQPKKKAGDKPMTREDIMNIKDSSERQAAIAEHIDLFNGGE